MKRLSRLLVAFIAALIMVSAVPSGVGALEPPRPGELAKLAEQGKLDEAIAAAKELGTDEYSPDLEANVRRQLDAIATGKRDSLIMSAPATGLYSSRMRSIGTNYLPVILIDFDDYPATITQSQLQELVGGNGGTGAAYPMESLTNYYRRSSNNLLNLQPQVLGIYHYPGPRSAIPVDGEQALVQQAFRYFDDQGVDFTQFDNDGNGNVDYPIVFWTGPRSEWMGQWWGHYGESGSSIVLYDGKRLGTWSWQWEPLLTDPTSNQVVIHETGHALGLPDLYDYDENVGPDGGVGGMDVMHYNRGDHNAFSKWSLGWSVPGIVSGDTSAVSLDVSPSSSQSVIVTPGFSATSPYREFYLVEARNKTQNDAVSFYPTDSRLMVWHVDATLNAYQNGYRFNNSRSEHKFLRLMEADGLEEIEGSGLCFDTDDLWNVGQTFSPTSVPNSSYYDGSTSGVSVSNISRSGSTMSFTASASAPVDPNDRPGDIPGGSLGASPVSAWLSAAEDHNDVYAVQLTAGDRISISLNGAAGTDFDMSLFGPGTTSISGATQLASATSGTYPDTISYTAATTGTHYLNTYVYSGAGSYTLTYSITRTDHPNNIPGVALPGNPFSTTLDNVTDPHDVFYVDLVAGQELAVNLTGSQGTDFDMALYAPSATSIGGSILASALSSSYPDRLTYLVPTTGRYYLDVYSYSGAGTYTVNYSVTSDDNIPGRPLPGSPYSTTISTVTDVHDVYSVELLAGQLFTVRLDGPLSSDLDLRLFDSASTSINTGAMVAYAGGNSYPDTLTYTATATGTYYLDVLTLYGSGTYTLNHSVMNPASLVVSASATAPLYGRAVQITGTLTNASTGSPIVGEPLVLQRSTGTGWSDFAPVVTDASGQISYSVSQLDRTYYRLTAGGDGSTVLPVESNGVTIVPAPSVGNPYAPTTMRRSTAYTVYGYLRPKHASGSRPIRIYKWKRTSTGAWRSYGYVLATASNYSTYSKYSVRMSLPSTGKWRLRAYHPADGTHAASWSASYDYVTVR